MFALQPMQTGYPVGRLPVSLPPGIPMQTGQLGAGPEVSLGTASLGGLVLAAGAVYLAYKFWFQPRLAPGRAAREALSRKEKLRLSELETENEHLTNYIDKIYCAVRDVASAAQCRSTA